MVKDFYFSRKVSKNQKHFGKSCVRQKGSKFTVWFQHQSILSCFRHDPELTLILFQQRMQITVARVSRNREERLTASTRITASSDSGAWEENSVSGVRSVVSAPLSYTSLKIFATLSHCLLRVKVSQVEAKCRYILLGSGLLLPVK